jgi:hypothetical protein
MNIEDINEKMGDLTVELSKQFQAELIQLAETEGTLLGLLHEVGENPEMYFSILGPKLVHLACAYNEAVNSYMSLDELIVEEWCQSPPSLETPEVGEGPPTISPDVLRFPRDAVIDPYNHPDGPSR